MKRTEIGLKVCPATYKRQRCSVTHSKYQYLYRSDFQKIFPISRYACDPYTDLVESRSKLLMILLRVMYV